MANNVGQVRVHIQLVEWASVILATGELCLKSSLQPGMKIFGADSKIHTLKGIEIRKVPAFEIFPRKSEPFLIGFDQKILAKSKTNDPLLLTATDYAEFSKRFQREFTLAKDTIDFAESALPLDPYFLGLLLGDGSFRCTPIKLTTPDIEIVQALNEFSEKYEWPVSVYKKPNNLSDDYYFKRAETGKSLKQIIVSLELYDHKSNTKFIPKQYLYADKRSRQALLGGLLDTDGYLSFRHYDYQSASFQLANDIAFLARSLGFLVVERTLVRIGRTLARLYIHGDFSEIPIRIKRKICRYKQNIYHERFAIKPAGINDIQYLDVDSYLQGDFTVRIGGLQ